MKEKFKSWAFSKEHGKCDVITLIIYLLGVCTVSFFHEPWFDEAQSWAIARSGTIKEILFEIPHATMAFDIGAFRKAWRTL